MKIQVVSDLHLEFSDLDLHNNQARVLVLCGDILLANRLDRVNSELGKRFRSFVEHASNTWQDVIVVAGNHEHYDNDFYKTYQQLQEYYSKFPNVHFLECGTKTIEDVVFVGGTLWTDMNKQDPLTLWHCQRVMNDFQLIRNSEKNYARLKPWDTVEYHKKTLEYFAEATSRNPKCVVVSHHSPSWLGCHTRYQHDHHVNGAYHTDLYDWIAERPHIKWWLHGHVHNSVNYKVNNCTVVANPRGYNTENSEFNPNLVVTV